jgi:hypothetical protein
LEAKVQGRAKVRPLLLREIRSTIRSPAESWENFPTRGVASSANFLSRFENPRNSAIFPVWHGSCNTVSIGGMTRRAGQGEFT